jgi:hypothetical protein
MLVSPIMGPVLAVTIAMRCPWAVDLKQGAATGLASLAACIAVGALVALAAAPFPAALDAWPT